MFDTYEIRGQKIQESKAYYMPKPSGEENYLAGRLYIVDMGIDFWYTHKDDPRKTFPPREEAIKNLNIFLLATQIHAIAGGR